MFGLINRTTRKKKSSTLSSTREYLDVGRKALSGQARAQQVWQDLQLDSCAHWLMFELLLHVASLAYNGQNIIINFGNTGGSLRQQIALRTNLCFKRNIPQIDLVHLVDDHRVVPINDAVRRENRLLFCLISNAKGKVWMHSKYFRLT